MYILINRLIPLIGGFSEKPTEAEKKAFIHREIDVEACKTSCDAIVSSGGNSYLVADKSEIKHVYTHDKQLFFTLRGKVLQPLAVGESAEQYAALRTEISQCKKQLQDTDWTVTKCLELGIKVSEKYPEIHRQRIQFRARINENEQQVNRLFKP